ncbi:atypical/HisK protein kinase [Coprinopsis cinerea AmutBmut pab1-1]|nr:atypical/HisK protein kinase [Coprinopsis cinerea AmutBmut pab1-1]
MPFGKSKPDANDPRIPQLAPPPSSSSFVYPVKTLLTGKIQPAIEQASSSTSSESSSKAERRRSLSDIDSGSLFHVDHHQSAELAPSPGQRAQEAADESKVEGTSGTTSTKTGYFSTPSAGHSPQVAGEPPPAAIRRRSNTFSSINSPSNDDDAPPRQVKAPDTPKKQKKRRKNTNYYHYPAGEQTTPRRFSTVAPTSPESRASDSSAPQSPVVSSLSATDYAYTEEPEVVPDVPLPLLAADALAATAAILPFATPPMPTVTPTNTAPEIGYFPPMAAESDSLPSTESQSKPSNQEESNPPPSDQLITPGLNPVDDVKEEEPEPSEYLPFNLSETGIVHLPSLPPSKENTEDDSSRGTSRSPYWPGSGSGRRSTHSSNPGSSDHRRKTSKRGKKGSSRSHEFTSSPLLQTASQPYSSSGEHDDSHSSRLSISSGEHHMTVQFEHVETEDGHHVIMGREGKLQRCEDEPIRTPGAVQGFGVLIALDDLEDVLLVRQVSENATEMLGLPPKYLFSLECFSDALPDHQVDVLWDNIHFLTEPDTTADDDSNSPHVFRLSGWGAPGSALPGDPDAVDGRRTWTCWCAAHRAEGFSAPDSINPGLIIIEFELERDKLNPLYPPMDASAVSSPSTSSGASEPLFTGGKSSPASGHTSSGTSVGTPSGISDKSKPSGIEGEESWLPSASNILESTTSYSKPIPALERLRRMSRPASSSTPQTGTRRDRKGRNRPPNERGGAVGMMDVFAVMAQINEQIGAAPDLDTFLKIVVGVIKDLTQFHRVMIYQFDEMWNGEVVAELVDWAQSHDLFKGLHFPSGDIPAQARALYAVNKVRLLYDRAQPTARIVCRAKEDLDTPLDMTHCYLRAMSPIHVKYLENMGVRASMSISIMAFDQLWGLVACHTYGNYGMRVSFPVRQILRLLSQSISRNIERLSYAQRLHTRKLVNTITSEQHPTGYIVSNADDLLGLFDADFGILVIGEGAKILGPNQHGQEILVVAEYLRLKQFDTIQASQSVIADYPDLKLTTGLEVIAGLLYVPLSRGGGDFIAFLRRGQPRHVNWAGKPLKEGQNAPSLEPRKSFKIWSETVAGRCRAWNDEQLETAGVLALVYGKFIEVWRQKQTAMQSTKLANLILNNASHEVRTPLNHIINYLEMALNGSLDQETRENLSRSHAASKSLLFTINDLLDLTRIESGNETSFYEPFNIHSAIEEATYVYKAEADRRGLNFTLELQSSPCTVIGDSKKIKTVVQNLTANALKYTAKGSITVTCTTFCEPEGLRDEDQIVVEIVVADTGCGIESVKLESIFREFEQVESTEGKSNTDAGVGLGLAVVARIVEQLGGQLRVDSVVDEGSRFSFLIPLSLSNRVDSEYNQSEGSSQRSSGRSSLARSAGSPGAGSGHSNDIDTLVDVLASNKLVDDITEGPPPRRNGSNGSSGSRHAPGTFPVTGSKYPVRPVKIDNFEKAAAAFASGSGPAPLRSPPAEREHRKVFVSSPSPQVDAPPPSQPESPKLRVLIVEDNDINRVILAKRLTMKGHTVVNTTNGQEGLDMVKRDQAFDVIFMDIQMPILNGFEATEQIRQVEPQPSMPSRPSCKLNDGRIPIFAVSASLKESQRDELAEHGMDGWILKPIDFKRLNTILKGVLDPDQRKRDMYRMGYNWEDGGWLHRPESKSGSRKELEEGDTTPQGKRQTPESTSVVAM